jgi:hypothetical protein
MYKELLCNGKGIKSFFPWQDSNPRLSDPGTVAMTIMGIEAMFSVFSKCVKMRQNASKCVKMRQNAPNLNDGSD